MKFIFTAVHTPRSIMELLIVASLLLLSGYSSGARIDFKTPPPKNQDVKLTVDNCGTSSVPQARIVGGTTAPEGKYPWMVSIHMHRAGKMQQTCGGAVLNENWIVTAAHCIDQPLVVKNYELYVGLHDITKRDAPTVQKLEISEFIPHFDYKKEGLKNDIALIKTATQINIKKSKGYVNGICLPPPLTNPSGTATVIGWGMIKSGGPIPAKLREVTIPIIEWKACKAIYGSNSSDFEEAQVAPAIMCAGGNGKDSCQYDSGGPLFQYDKKGVVATLIGVVASGGDCGYGKYPGLYTKVSGYRSWMMREMSKHA